MKYKVLIIDDEPFMRKSMRSMVDWEGFDCEICGEADGAEEGAALIERIQPDIVFTDIRMQDRTGLEMLHGIKRLPQHCKIIVITGYREFDYVLDALKTGIFAFLLKPISSEEIAENVQKAIAAINEERDNDYRMAMLDKIAQTKTTVFDELNEVTAKLLSFAESSGNGDVREIKARISELLCKVQNDSKIYKPVYRYLQYIIIEAFIKSAGTYDYSHEFIASNIDRLVVEPFDYAEMDEWLLLQVDNIAERCVPKRVDDKRVEAMLDYIGRNYNKDITLENVAKHALISYHYASKLFKQHTGKSFVEYLNYIRIEKAKELCSRYEYRDYEIAEKVGVDNIYYFSRLFKKYTGMSTTEFRRKNRL